MTTISTLPSAPSRSDPANFRTRADALLGALATFVTETNTVAGEVNTNASTASSGASTATTQAGIATTQAGLAAASATSAAAAANATIWVTGTTYAIGDCRFSPSNSQTYRRKTNGAGSTDPASDATNWQIITSNVSTGANTFTGAQVLSDQQVSRAMLIDTGYTVYDKGNVSNATFDIAYTAGSIQTYTATGSTVTITSSAWPPTGNLGEVLLIATNAGAYTHSWPSWNWIKPDGTTTTSIATYLAANTGRTALQSSGVDQILIWTRDAGTTIYAKLV